MRVISGIAKGIPLRPVPGQGTRPITDRVKESLFNILGAFTVGARFLDLFAGTGSVGIEALSRGADQVVFVERNPKAISTIHANLRKTRLTQNATIIRRDVFKYLGSESQPFDLVYVAPPQYEGLWSKTLQSLDADPSWLAPNGMIVVQIFPKEFETLDLTTLTLARQEQYGSTMLCFYESRRQDL